jgi:hypothetical protein
MLQCTVEGEQITGVAKFDTASGDVGLVHEDGEVPVAAGEPVAINSEIATTDAGKAKVAEVGDHIVAYARSAAAAEDEELIVKLSRGVQVKA